MLKCLSSNLWTMFIVVGRYIGKTTSLSMFGEGYMKLIDVFKSLKGT